MHRKDEKYESLAIKPHHNRHHILSYQTEWIKFLDKSFLSGCDAPKNVSTILQQLLSQCRPMGKGFLSPCASRDAVITQFGHYLKLPSKLGALPGGS